MTAPVNLPVDTYIERRFRDVEKTWKSRLRADTLRR